jgi:HAD superfamily hydrolase (TIGR01662 family)
METLETSVVIPTLGRPSLRILLECLAASTGPVPREVLVVDDRVGGAPLDWTLGGIALANMRVVRSGGGGPAKARNVGWRLARTEWVSFLDDDVVPDADWLERLAEDLTDAGADIAGIAVRVTVPLPQDRRPTDWERTTAGLATAQWITADLTYRRSALRGVGGFDERFPRAFREDADLGLRVSCSQGRISRGRRRVSHPVRPVDDWVSVRQQAGNADDALMRRLHGPSWRSLVGAAAGRRPRHVAVTTCAAAAVALTATGRRRAAGVAALGWFAGVTEFAVARIAPGPRDRSEIRRMVVTSAVIPFAATWHTAHGRWRHRRAQPWRGIPDLVLFDRDGTLVRDVPYNGEPAAVTVLPGAPEAIARLRSAGVQVGIVTNQSGVASGRISCEQVAAVNARVAELLGPLDVWQVCPHGPDEGCACRKPAPGMVKAACQALDVTPARCVVIGDIGSDVEAAESAGATGILVPTTATRPEEVSGAASVAPDLEAAVDLVLAGEW